MKGFKVTVEDLETGDKSAMVIAAGDYIFIPLAPCYLASTDANLEAGTHVLTVKNHRPQDAPKQAWP